MRRKVQRVERLDADRQAGSALQFQAQTFQLVGVASHEHEYSGVWCKPLAQGPTDTLGRSEDEDTLLAGWQGASQS